MNQATNYTAAAAEWHLDLRASWEVKKNHMKSGVVAEADVFLFFLKYPGPISSLANRQTESRKGTENRKETPGASRTTQKCRDRPSEHSREILGISVELQQTLRCSWEDTVMLKLQEPPADSKPLTLERLRVCDTAWWKNKSESSPPSSPNALILTGGYPSLLYSSTMRGRTLSIICPDPPQKSWSLITVFTEAFCNTLATPQGCKWQQNAYVGINN